MATEIIDTSISGLLNIRVIGGAMTTVSMLTEEIDAEMMGSTAKNHRGKGPGNRRLFYRYGESQFNNTLTHKITKRHICRQFSTMGESIRHSAVATMIIIRKIAQRIGWMIRHRKGAELFRI